jgi:hypothetical protein
MTTGLVDFTVMDRYVREMALYKAGQPVGGDNVEEEDEGSGGEEGAGADEE